jgi:hypothetical protein
MSSYNQESAIDSQQNPVIRFFAGFFSYLFHPLLVGFMLTAYLIYGQSDFFTGISAQSRLQDLVIYIFNGVFLPFFGVLLCKALGFVQSIYLRTQKERILPYSISIIFFFWTFYVFRNKADTPLILAQLSLGIFLATSLAFIFNIFFKISMHATAVGGLVGFFLALLYSSAGGAGVGPALLLSVLIAGIVGSSRLILTDHRMMDIVFGLILGIACQLVAAAVI